ncbi:hypothetical protein NC652_006134 [Populus alba x Populus x berolinensis]|nr:hypothetical protein NC652_006134 [Populus alba x Populus x berolinensis]
MAGLFLFLMKQNTQGCWNSIIRGSVTKGFNDELTGIVNRGREIQGRVRTVLIHALKKVHRLYDWIQATG